MGSKFIDIGQALEDFIETIDVRCPNCDRHAYVMRIPSEMDEIIQTRFGHYSSWHLRVFGVRKLSCLHCAHTKVWKSNERGYSSNFPCDWYFHCPLWLQTPCCGKILWACNAEHLSFLERYVAAKQREKFNVEGQIRSKTLANGLPYWIKSAKNRQEILKGIARLRAMLQMS